MTPALCGGAATVQSESVVHSSPPEAVEPNLNLVAIEPSAKPLPLTVTLVPPLAGPELGLTPVIVGGPARKRSLSVTALVPFGVVTVTSTLPAGRAGELTVIALDDSVV